MTYYLKYRPQKLEELDLKDVRESLKKIVKSGKIPHAFLFSGPKGSGKTSAARILAKIVNCEKRRSNSIEPCNKCYQCSSITKGGNVDVIELDAASHRGIDDVRSLRSAVKLAPAKANKKVYIIDEAHMLTPEASNALLKTLEEPPAHVIFILATTNPEKLIETIRSRTTNIVFGKATTDEVVRSLKKKVKGERLKGEEKVLKLISEASGGAFRDADKILEQLVTEKVPLEIDEVGEFLFRKKTVDVEQFLLLLASKEVQKALSAVEKVVSAGVSMRVFLEAVIARLRSALLNKVGLEGKGFEEFTKQDLVSLIKLFSRAASELPQAVLEQIPAEIAIVEWCEKEIKNPSGSDQSRNSNLPSSRGLRRVGGASMRGKQRSQQKLSRKSDQRVSELVKSATKSAKSITDEVWAKILSQVKPRNTSTEALLRAAKPKNYDGETLELGVFYRFHKERLEDVQHRRILEDVVEGILGNSVRVICTLTEPLKRVAKKESSAAKSKESNFSTTPHEHNLAETDPVLTGTEDEDIIKVAKEIFGS